MAKSTTEKELDKVDAQFKDFDKQVKEMTQDNLNKAPLVDTEQQTKIAQKDIQKMPDHYLKPIRQIGSREKFNENYREDYNFATQYVHFVAENKEIIGEEIDIWTKPFAGMPAQEWKVPVNKPVWGPRHLAEQIKKARHHRLIMQENKSTGTDGRGEYYGTMTADVTVQRLDAIPVAASRSVFMGSSEFV